MTRGSSTRALNTLIRACAWAMLLGTPAAAFGQGGAPGAPLGTARAAIEDRAAVDSFFALVPELRAAELDAAIERSRADERTAAGWRARYDRDLRRTREVHAEQALEIDRAGRGIRIADDLGQSSRKEMLEKERKLRERYRDLLTVQIEGLERAILAAEAEERHARATRERLEIARSLSDARTEWRRPVAPGAEEDRRRLEAAIFDQLESYLRALRSEQEAVERLAAARRSLAGKQIEVVEKRAKLFED